MTYTFETALVFLKQGKKIRRKSWWQPEEYLYLNKGSVDCATMHMIDPEEMESDEFMAAWEDILAEDWEVLE